MPKERPIKSYRVEGERPFKSYNPAMSQLSQYDDQTYMEQCLPAAASFLMQPQQQSRYRQQQQQQHLQQEPLLPSSQMGHLPQQFYHPQFQQNQMNLQNVVPNTDSSNFIYNSLTLGDPSSSIGRSGLTASGDSNIQQREHFMNNPSFSENSSLNPSPLFNVPNMPNVNTIRAMTDTVSGQDSMSLLFDNSIASFNGSLTQRHTTTTSTLNQFPTGTPQFTQSGSSSFYGVPGSSQSRIDLTTSDRRDPYPVKEETEDSSLIMDGSNIKVNLPTQSHVTNMAFNDSLVSFSAGPMSTASTSRTSPSSVKSTSSAVENQSRSDGERSTSEERKNETYMEKRRKNNESAKRSREARRNKEEIIALRVINLEEENMRLRAEIALLDKELDELRTRLFQCS